MSSLLRIETQFADGQKLSEFLRARASPPRSRRNDRPRGFAAALQRVEGQAPQEAGRRLVHAIQ